MERPLNELGNRQYPEEASVALEAHTSLATIPDSVETMANDTWHRSKKSQGRRKGSK